MELSRTKIMVLAGGPDRERPVSLQSGQSVARALGKAGYNVRLRDVGPNDQSALDEWHRWGGDVVFPVLHGPWGEGGALQQLLDQQGITYVGSQAKAAQLAMDKRTTKQVLVERCLPTPEFELIGPGQRPSISPPVVLKPVHEGSSIDVAICRDAVAAEVALQKLFQDREELLVERFIAGKEMTSRASRVLRKRSAVVLLSLVTTREKHAT